MVLDVSGGCRAPVLFTLVFLVLEVGHDYQVLHHFFSLFLVLVCTYHDNLGGGNQEVLLDGFGSFLGFFAVIILFLVFPLVRSF